MRPKAVAGGAHAAPHSCFAKPHFAAEVADWLRHRATAAEAQRAHRYLGIIAEAAAARSPAHRAHQHRLQRPATTCSASATSSDTKQQQQQQHQQVQGSQHTATLAALRRRSAGQLRSPVGSMCPGSARPGSACSPAAAAALPAFDLSGSGDTAAAAGAPDPCTLAQLSARGSAATVGSKSVYVTTSQAVHGLKDLYPELWRATAPICRPDPAPNKNFISEWGQSLQQGAGEAWRPYLATTSQLANLQVAKPTDEFAVRADEALIAWVSKQHTYAADLLSPPAAAAVAALLGGCEEGGSSSGSSGSSGQLSLPERKELVGVLRQLAAVVQPHRPRSSSHVLHCKQESVEHAATTALLKAQTRIRTMGHPRKVVVKGFAPATRAHHSAAATAAHHGDGGHCGRRPQATAAAAAGSLQKTPLRRGADSIDTQQSRVPLKWAGSAVAPAASSYTSSFGANPGRSPQMVVTKFRKVNVGLGAVDPHLHPPSSSVYPVESLYLQLPAKAQAHAAPRADAIARTTHAASYGAAAGTR